MTLQSITRLETELSEEPPVLTGLEPLLQPLLRLLACGDLLVTRRERITSDGILQIHIERVTGRHEVSEIHDLEERLDARFLSGFLGGVLSDNLLGVFGKTSDEAVAIRAVAVASFVDLHDHSLATSVAAVEDDHRLVWLKELHHFVLHSRRRRGGDGLEVQGLERKRRRKVRFWDFIVKFLELGFSVERAELWINIAC